MQLYIKIWFVIVVLLRSGNLLDDLKLPFTGLQLGEVILFENAFARSNESFKGGLHGLGFEILGDVITRIIEKIKTVIIKYVHYGIGDENINFQIYMLLKCMRIIPT